MKWNTEKVRRLIAMYDSEGRRLWPQETKPMSQPCPSDQKGIVLSFEGRHIHKENIAANVSMPFPGGDAA